MICYKYIFLRNNGFDIQFLKFQEHNDKTMAKFEASIASIEEEIKIAKSSFEEDLLKIESKMSQNPESLLRDEDLLHEVMHGLF